MSSALLLDPINPLGLISKSSRCFTSSFTSVLTIIPFVILTLIFRLFLICIVFGTCEVWFTVQPAIIFGSIRLIFFHTRLRLVLALVFPIFISTFRISRNVDVACGCTTWPISRNASFLCCSTSERGPFHHIRTSCQCFETDDLDRCKPPDTRIFSSLRFSTT